MRILWFTNIPVIASAKLGVNVYVGGWLSALASKLIQNGNIELGFAFYHNIEIEPFIESEMAFFPIYNKLDKRINAKWRKFRSIDEGCGDIEKFKEVIKVFKPDLIHIHGTELAFGRLIENTKIPVVISIQGNTTVISHFFHRGISKAELNKYLTLKDKVKLTSFNRNSSLFLKKAQREQSFSQQCRYIIGRTSWDKKINLILSPNARYFHNDEILREEFYQYEWKSMVSKEFIIYTTSANLLFKGFDTIVESAILLKQKTTFNFIWKIGGINENDSVVKLFKKKYGPDYPDNKIKLLGRLSSQLIIKELMGANLYVMPSHIENSPNNLCEAMILGLPCIGTFAGGTNSILQDGSEGILVQDGDPWAMSGAIIDLANNPKMALDFGKKARYRALKRHNPDKIIKELLNIYKIIVSDNK